MKKPVYFYKCKSCKKDRQTTEGQKDLCQKCEKFYVPEEQKDLFEMNKLLLPRKYLSYSQMTCWMTNPERYRREYFENGKKLDTKYLRFGKGIAKMIENGVHKELLPDLEVLGIPEYEIRCLVKDIPILSFIDDYESFENVFQEFKTGKVAWNPARVQKHEQLAFYATGLKWKLGKMPEYCNLVWIETREDGHGDDFWAEAERQVNVTGRIVSFRREFDEREIERMENLIVKVAWEISDAYKAFLSEEI